VALRWKIVTSRKPKFATDLFIKEDGSNGQFIAKAYGFDGQDALENAQMMVDAPVMVDLLVKLLRDIELASRIINGREAKSENIRSAKALVRKFGVNL